MSKVKAGNIEMGMYILYNAKPHKVIKRKFVSPGKGSAFNRTKLQNLETGAIFEHVFKSHDSVEEVFVESKMMQYLYHDGENVFFMDPRSYEQIEVLTAVVGSKMPYFVPEIMVYVITYEDKPLAVSFPPKVTMLVTEAEEAVAGDRSNAGTKPVTMETGLVVQVPLFVKNGEKLIIDTEDGNYVSRAST